MSDLIRSILDWLRRGRSAAPRPSLDDRSVQRAIAERVARSPASLHEDGLRGIRIGDRLDANLAAVKTLAGDAPDLVVRELEITGGPRAAAVFLRRCAARTLWPAT